MRVEAIVCRGRDARASRGLAAAGLAVICFVALLVGVPGCSRQAPPTGEGDDLRIVSFMPSATRIVVDLGLGDRLVGVAEHDAAAPTLSADGEPMPIVGNYMDVDVERLLSLRPTHVIFPESLEALPPAVVAAGVRRVSLSYPRTLDAAWSAIEVVGSALGERDAAERLRLAVVRDAFDAAAALERSLANPAMEGFVSSPSRDVEHEAEIHRRLGGIHRPTALMVFSVDPVVASGPGTINDELLKLARAQNAVGDAAVSAVMLDREALIAVNPDVIVLLLPGEDEAAAAQKIAWFDGLPIAAVEKGRVHALTDPQVLLPSTNLPKTLEQLVGVIWGGDFGAALRSQTLEESSRES